MTRRRWVQAVVAAALLSGCDSAEVPAASGGVLSRGESVEELRERARVVLAVPPSTFPSDAPSGAGVQSAVVSPSGTRIRVAFTGAVSEATEPCGISYLAEAVESPRAVAVILIEQRHAYGEMCTMVGRARTATLNLARPLAGRPLLDVQQGNPIPLSIGTVPE